MEKEQQPRIALRLQPPPPRRDPWLVQIHGKKEEIQTFFSVSEGRYHVKSIPEMRGKRICATYQGWLVLKNSYSSADCILFNPMSLQKFEFPSWETTPYHICLLTSPPEQPNCTILLIGSKRNIGKNYTVQGFKVSFTFWHPKNDNWIRKEINFREKKINAATCFNGKIYMLDSLHNLLLLELEPIFGIRDVGVRRPREGADKERIGFKSTLIESDGELFAVLGLCHPDFDQIFDFEIYRLNLDEKVWEIVENTGDRVFFVGFGSCAWCWGSEAGIKGNTIYFTYENDRCLYEFDVEEKSITVTLPFPNVKNNWDETAQWVLLPLV
ncbi:hypothetical protein SLE2022_082330 [Rubroshorea leprosula]